MSVREISGAKHYTGLSTDTKPTTGTLFGSTFYEEDTGDKYRYGESGWFIEGTNIIANSAGNVTVQNPFPTDGDSVYCKDIDQARSNSTGWTGDICDLFGEIHTELYRDDATNPKTIIVHFNRTTEFGSIGLGNAEGGDFSNVKITVRNPGVVETVVVDESSDNTKLTSVNYELESVYQAESIKVEFFTADRVGLSNIFIPKVRAVRVDANNIENPIHVIDTDHAERIGANTVFGDRIVGQKKASIAAQFNYGIRDRDYNKTELNGGTVAVADSLLTISTSTNAAGEAAAESVEYLRYVPGNEAFFFFTAVFTTPQANSRQYAGLFDDDDGFYFGYNGTDFVIARRRNAVDTQEIIDVTKVYPLEEFDPQMGNVYKISFGYLGFATINFEVLSPNGSWISFGQFNYPNTSTTTHIANSNLPIRGEVVNTGNTTDITLSTGSVSAGIVDGGGTDPSARQYNFDLRDALGAQPTIATGNNLLVLFRNLTTFAGRTNRIKAAASILSAATEGNKTSTWRFVYEPTVVNTPTWNPISGGDSIIEYALDGVVTFGTGEIGVSWGMARTDSFFEVVKELSGEIRPGQIVAIEVISGGASEVEFSMNWGELF